MPNRYFARKSFLADRTKHRNHLSFLRQILRGVFCGILESKNVDQYAQASEYAKELGLKEYFVEFIEMQKAEAEHESVCVR